MSGKIPLEKSLVTNVNRVSGRENHRRSWEEGKKGGKNIDPSKKALQIMKRKKKKLKPMLLVDFNVFNCDL